MKPERTLGPRTFRGTVTVTQLVDDNDLDPDDLEENPSGTYKIAVRAYSRESAIELILDAFHGSTAIHCLDDFEIEAEADEGDLPSGHFFGGPGYVFRPRGTRSSRRGSTGAGTCGAPDTTSGPPGS